MDKFANEIIYITQTVIWLSLRVNFVISSKS